MYACAALLRSSAFDMLRRDEGWSNSRVAR
jgi:hypothetical protein